MAEQWRDIIGYESIYIVSDQGRIKRIASGQGAVAGKILIPINTGGYPSVNLFCNGIRKLLKIHSLVLEAFVGSRPIGMECCHNDGNPMNSKLNNLRWGTHSENMLDSVKHKTHCYPNTRGQKNGKAKLTDIQVKKIKHLIISGISCKQIAKLFHVHSTTIYYIAAGKTWRHI